MTAYDIVKMAKKTKNVRRRSLRKTRRRKMIRGGTCGCSKPLFTGGNANIPTPYELNNYNNDPNNNIISSRILPNMKFGGKKQKSKKMRGGTSMLNGMDMHNPFNSTDILKGTANYNSNAVSQSLAGISKLA